MLGAVAINILLIGYCWSALGNAPLLGGDTKGCFVTALSDCPEICSSYSSSLSGSAAAHGHASIDTFGVSPCATGAVRHQAQKSRSAPGPLTVSPPRLLHCVLDLAAPSRCHLNSD